MRSVLRLSNKAYIKIVTITIRTTHFRSFLAYVGSTLLLHRVNLKVLSKNTVGLHHSASLELLPLSP